MNNKKYKLLNPISGLLKYIPRLILEAKYYRTFGRRLNLKSPTYLYDKALWLSLNTDTSEWSVLADKYEVRERVAAICGDEILTKLYGVWDNPMDIDFDKLPNSFILKTTNGCASNVVVSDKATADVEAIKKELSDWINIKYGAITGQPHYSRIKPRIIAEQLLIQDGDPNKPLIDYKFYCFDGYVHCCAVYTDRMRNSHQFAITFYDMNWQPHPEYLEAGRYTPASVEKPVCFEQMKEIASKLSRGHKYVRVDLYNIDGKPIFGELTFTPGLDHHTIEFQKELGDLVKI